MMNATAKPRTMVLVAFLLFGMAASGEMFSQQSADKAANPAVEHRGPPGATRQGMQERAARNAIFSNASAAVASLPALRYAVLTKVADDVSRPNIESEITVAYEGSYMDGEVFVASTTKQALMKFMPGVAIALLQMKRGEEWLVYIPYQLFFGPNGGEITKKRDVVFKLKILEIHDAARPAS
jgi:FKBP-type peptidyl-prolyl cis-trans isomerase